MDAKRWQQIKALLDEALELDADRRAALLDRTCADDPALRAAAEELLAAYDQAGEFLEPGSTEPMVELSEEISPELEPSTRRIGPYRLLEKIGEGAFGEVFLARQLEPVRRERVAIKMIKPGMDSRSVLARFETERQALALMNHPNIATVLDAGVAPGGRPYFVMEYVPGVPITEHCDRHRLTIEQRLELFCMVGEAIQHAHQKGVIHRDIKPSNVLVAFQDDRATPKVIDFGVAKAIDRSIAEHTIYTRQGDLIGTPAYMSPEQADRSVQDIDTRSDVYALGVLLYELLTGVLPFDPGDLLRAGYDEMRRIIREEDPPKPSNRISTLSRSGGDDSQRLADRRKVHDPRTLERRMREDLDWIALKCLEKDRMRRYTGAAALVADVRRHLNQEPVEAGPPSVAYRMRKFVRRHRGAVASVSVIAIVLLAAVSVSTWLAVDLAWQREEGRKQQVELNKIEARVVLDEARALAAGLGTPEQTRRRAEDALALDPALDDARILRVTTLVASGAGEIDRAIAEARVAFVRSGESPALAALLAGFLAEKNPEQADRFLSLARDTLEEDSLLYYRALATLDDARAIEMLDASLKLNPWQYDVQEHLIQRLLETENKKGEEKKEKLERALREARLLTRVARELPLSWILVAVTLEIQEKYDESLSVYDQVIELAPQNWLGHAGRAWVYFRLEKWQNALDNAEHALELSPGNLYLQELIGAVNVKLERWDAAVEALDRVIASGPSFKILRDRCMSHQNLGNFQRALTDCRAAIDYPYPNEGELAGLRNLTGYLLQITDRFDESRRELLAALEIDPNHEEALASLGRLEFVQGRDHAALAALERVIELIPEKYASDRGIVHWFLGNRDEAIRDLAPYAAQHETPYAWLWEIETEAGNHGHAQKALDDALADTEQEFVRLMVAFLRDERPFDDLLEAAESPGDQLVAYLTAAGRARLQGDVDETRQWLTAAIDVGKRNWQEHRIAVRRLADLSAVDGRTAP